MKRLVSAFVFLFCAVAVSAQVGSPFDVGSRNPFGERDVVAPNVSSSKSAAANVAAIRAAIRQINQNGGGTLLFPASVGAVPIAFDDLATEYYGLFKFRSNFKVVMEPGAKLVVTGDFPAIFAGVFGPDVGALPVSNVDFVNLNIEDTISITHPDPLTRPQLVRAITFTPTHTMPASSVKDIDVEGGTFIGLASPFLSVTRNSSLGPWEFEIEDLRIRNVYIYDAISAGATLDGKNITFDNGHVYGAGAASYDGISIHACDDCKVTNSFFSNFNHPSGITLHVQNSNIAINGVVKGTRKVLLDNNTIANCYGASKEIGVSVVANSPQGTTNVAVTNNKIINGGRGIQFNQNGAVGSPFHTFTIADNRAWTRERGIDVIGNLTTMMVYDFTVTGNIVRVTAVSEPTAMTGTVTTMAAGGTALVGNGTLFLTELTVGDWIEIAGHFVKVSAIADNLNATVSAYPGRVAATGSTLLKYGQGVTAANSWGIRVQNAERGLITNNDFLVVNGSTNARTAFFDGMRDAQISTNTFTATDESIVSFVVGTSTPLNRCTFKDNTVRGLTTWDAGKFVLGHASGNRFNSSTPEFNDHNVGLGIVWGCDGSTFWKQGTAAPASEAWLQGDRVINTAPTSGGTFQWVCTTPGTPGTWTAHALP